MENGNMEKGKRRINNGVELSFELSNSNTESVNHG